jgi:hypothetical protein
MWYVITIVSSVSLVLFLGLAVFFPLRIAITKENHPDFDRHKPPRRQKHRTRQFDSDELYFDDDEL